MNFNNIGSTYIIVDRTTKVCVVIKECTTGYFQISIHVFNNTTQWGVITDFLSIVGESTVSNVHSAIYIINGTITTSIITTEGAVRNITGPLEIGDGPTTIFGNVTIESTTSNIQSTKETTNCPAVMV
ncbi:hypothetical protein DSECCO2_516090 [anaerobic digester metagenome]